jgi:hypothetical protein
VDRLRQRPDEALELLITPQREEPAGAVAIAIDRKMRRRKSAPAPDIAPLHNIVAARLTFGDVFRVLMPMTKWWHEPLIQSQYESFKSEDANAVRLKKSSAVVDASCGAPGGLQTRGQLAGTPPAFDRYIALSGLVLWAARQPTPDEENRTKEAMAGARQVSAGNTRRVQQCLDWIEKGGKSESLVWQISSIARRCQPRAIGASRQG